jgi:hypothetical protein
MVPGRHPSPSGTQVPARPDRPASDRRRTIPCAVQFAWRDAVTIYIVSRHGYIAPHTTLHRKIPVTVPVGTQLAGPGGGYDILNGDIRCVDARRGAIDVEVPESSKGPQLHATQRSPARADHHRGYSGRARDLVRAALRRRLRYQLVHVSPPVLAGSCWNPSLSASLYSRAVRITRRSDPACRFERAGACVSLSRAC